MRTLNEWESTALEEILSLSQTILASGFDNPYELHKQIGEISNILFQQCEKYEFYSNPNQDKIIALHPEFWPER